MEPDQNKLHLVHGRLSAAEVEAAVPTCERFVAEMAAGLVSDHGKDWASALDLSHSAWAKVAHLVTHRASAGTSELPVPGGALIVEDPVEDENEVAAMLGMESY